MRDPGPNLKFERPLFLPRIGSLRPLMGFEVMHERLVAYVVHKMRSGEVTERGLARLTGVSQPHLHHVLKGARLFSAQMADRVMEKLHVDLVTLLEEEGLGEQVRAATAVPLVEARLGPGRPFPDLARWQGAMPFLRVDVEGMRRPLAVRTAEDPRARHLFGEGDVALVDALGAAGSGTSRGPGTQASGRLEAPADAEERAAVDFSASTSYYAIDAGGSGLIRQVERRGDELWLRAGEGDAEPASIPLGKRHILEVVRAKVVWIGRYLEKPQIAARPDEEAG